MQSLSGNQRPDLLTSLINMSLVLRLLCEIHLCRSSSNVPGLPSFLEMLQNLHALHIWQGAQSLAPDTRKHIWTSKSAPYPKVFCTFDFEMCFAPQRRKLFRHRNFQNWSEHGVFCTCWLRDVLRATTAWNCSFLIWPAGSAPAALANLLFDPPEPRIIGKKRCFVSFLPFRAPASSDSFSSLIFSLLLFSSLFFCSISAFHLSILSEVWLLNFLRLMVRVKIAYPKQITNAQSNCGFLIHLRNLYLCLCLWCLSVSVSASVSVSVQPALDLRRIGLVRENLYSRLKNLGFCCLTHWPTNWLGLHILSRHCRATIGEDQKCLPQADHECPVQLRVPDPST